MEKKITRMVASQEVDILVFDKETKELPIIKITLDEAVPESKLEKVVSKKLNETQWKLIEVKGSRIIESLYEMPLAQFISLAEKVSDEELAKRKQYILNRKNKEN